MVGGPAGLFALLLLRVETIKILIPATVSLLGGERGARKHRPCSPSPTSDETSFSGLESSTRERPPSAQSLPSRADTWAQDPLTSLCVMEGPKELLLLFLWITSIHTYHFRNGNKPC